MATFWEIAARSVVLFVFCLFVIFISRFGLNSGICLLIAPVPVHFFSITFGIAPHGDQHQTSAISYSKYQFMPSLVWGIAYKHLQENYCKNEEIYDSI